LVFRALQESKASEEAVRMVAMSSATENAREMIDDLTLLANKLRQAGITSEISEIVGGADALKG
jgi:F-type H+-transporting ATPase subunit gamma